MDKLNEEQKSRIVYHTRFLTECGFLQYDSHMNNLIKTVEEIAIMRKGCGILAHIMDAIEKKIDIGVSGFMIDELAENMIYSADCEPAFKGYGGDEDEAFPATICFSLNEGVVHGIPSEKKLQEGDVVKIDIGLKYKGYYADMARSFFVGHVSDEARNLVEITQKSFFKGLATIKDGSTLYDYAYAVQSYAESKGYHMVKNLVGHGIGKNLHEAPQIPNYVSKKMHNFTFQTGMTVALEPMVNIGTEETRVAMDGWTYETVDGSLSAHYENTILVTERGSEILTRIL